MMAYNETITEAPKDCDDTGAIWESGKVENHAENKLSFNIHFQRTKNVQLFENSEHSWADWAGKQASLLINFNTCSPKTFLRIWRKRFFFLVRKNVLGLFIIRIFILIFLCR